MRIPIQPVRFYERTQTQSTHALTSRVRDVDLLKFSTVSNAL